MDQGWREQDSPNLLDNEERIAPLFRGFHRFDGSEVPGLHRRKSLVGSGSGFSEGSVVSLRRLRCFAVLS